MPTTPYTKGLHEIGTGLYAYLLPDGSWGWSNAGLITSGDHSMLVDTLMTLGLTRDMIDSMRREVPAAKGFDTLVNSHADPDHVWGNQLVGNAQIVATKAASEEFMNFTPEGLTEMVSNAPNMGVTGEFIERAFGGVFDYSGITVTMPTRTFTGNLKLSVGDKVVELYDVGPAHSRGDLIVHVPNDKVAFVADLLFVDGHPALWAGPASNWIAVCDRLLSMDLDVVVPGHGPLTDKEGVREFRDYLAFLEAEGHRLHAEGLDRYEAALALDLSPWEHWSDDERVVIAMYTIYREIEQDTSPIDRAPLWTDMGRYLMEKRGRVQR
jgi:cyclase